MKEWRIFLFFKPSRSKANERLKVKRIRGKPGRVQFFLSVRSLDFLLFILYVYLSLFQPLEVYVSWFLFYSLYSRGVLSERRRTLCIGECNKRRKKELKIINERLESQRKSSKIFLDYQETLSFVLLRYLFSRFFLVFFA